MNTYVILSLIFILTIKFTREYNVRDLNEEAYTSITKSDEKWIVLFYVNNLEQNDIANDIFKKIGRKSKEQIKFGSIDCSINMKICLSLNINNVPEVLKLYNGKYKRMNDYYSYQSIKKLIKSEDYPEYIPSLVSTLDYMLIMINEGLVIFNNKINEYCENYEITIVWNYYHLTILFILSIVLVVVIEIWLLCKLYNVFKRYFK